MFKYTALQVNLRSGNHNIQWEDVMKKFMWFTIVIGVKRCQEYNKIPITFLKHRDCQLLKKVMFHGISYTEWKEINTQDLHSVNPCSKISKKVTQHIFWDHHGRTSRALEWDSLNSRETSHQLPSGSHVSAAHMIFLLARTRTICWQPKITRAVDVTFHVSQRRFSRHWNTSSSEDINQDNTV
jgi:hypothetical protein